MHFSRLREVDYQLVVVDYLPDDLLVVRDFRLFGMGPFGGSQVERFLF